MEIAIHPVGAGAEYLLLAVVVEVEHPGVLQEASHDGAHPDVVRDARDPGAQAADPPHDEVNLHPGLGGAVEGPDHLLLHHCVHLGDDAPWPPLLGQPGLPLDTLQNAGVEGEG